MAIFGALLVSCGRRHELLPDTEYVLTPGMKITAVTPNGRVEIVGGGGTHRTFSGEGWTTEVSLTPRTERWYGSLGLYDAADSFSPHGRLLVDEGRLFFDSESEALRYLYVGSDRLKPVFTNHGLVVGFGISPIPGGESARTVQLWQIYIRGKQPHTLRGAVDSAIQVQGGELPTSAQPHLASVGHEPTVGAQEYVPSR